MAENINMQIPSNQKAALMLVALGVDNAAQVMKNLTEQETEKIAIEIARLKNIPAAVLSLVIEEYYQLMIARQYIVTGGPDYAKEVLENAYGEAKAKEILKHTQEATEVNAFNLLQTVDNKLLLNFIKNEHPQTSALVLAKLKPDQAATLLAGLSAEEQADIAYRLTTLGKPAPELIGEVEIILRENIGTGFGKEGDSIGGPEAIAEILNFTSRAAEKNIMDHLKNRDAHMAEEISGMMFVYDDIIHLPDAAIQTIVKEVDSKVWAYALKSSSDEFKEKVFGNMSERAAEMLKDELQYLGPVKVSEVDTAQKKVVETVRKLEKGNMIVIDRSGTEDMVE
ncbi:MAG: flagellar motor switch protein FliG [Simkaniaceae bacterium]|nr:flagellar motor switch protein FliG [Simkaniaceae bacterium]